MKQLKHYGILYILISSCIAIFASQIPHHAFNIETNLELLKQKLALVSHLSNKTPKLWAETVPGVKNRLKTDKKVIALTLDLCGGKTDGCDDRYINFFTQEQIPTTIFVTTNWIQRHPQAFKKILTNPLFDIQSHGLQHKPCSSNGASAYNIQGTKDIAEIVEEVEGNAHILEQLTGKKPSLYRSGTAHYDEVAVEVVNALGYQVMGFDVVGDAGASYSKEQTYEAVIKSQPGSVVLLHMNRPEKPCAEGAIAAIKQLKADGYEFVKVIDCDLV